MTVSENQTSDKLDEKRRFQIAYEYLCHLEEVKVWLQHILKIELPDSTELENYMRNGVVLAQLGSFTAPKAVPEKKIYDLNLEKYKGRGLHFKHTDNINLFLGALQAVGLPKIFYPETNDIYGLKNPVRMIYCIHALSHLLAKQGRAPLIKNLVGQVEFSEEDINKVQGALEKYGIKMPAFSKIGGILAGELTEDDAAIHAGVMLISDAIDKGDLNLLLERLNNPVLHLLRVYPESIQDYFNMLKERKDRKVARSVAKKTTEGEEDVYDRILSLSEIQDGINNANLNAILKKLNDGLRSGDLEQVGECFLSPNMGDVSAIFEYKQKYAEFAMQYFTKFNQESDLSLDDVRSIISGVNEEEKRTKAALNFVSKIESLLASGDMAGLLEALKSAPDEFLSIDTDRKEFVFNFLNNFKNLKGTLDRETLAGALNLLKIVCEINKCVDNQDHTELYEKLQNPVIGISELDPSSARRYLDTMSSLKREREGSSVMERYDLQLEEIIGCVTSVNKFVQEELGKLEIVTKINENLSSMTPEELIQLLIDPRGRFKNVIVENGETYLQALKLRSKELGQHKTGESRQLWHNNVQEIIDEYNAAVNLANTRVKKIDTLNESIATKTNGEIMLNILKSLEVSGLIEDCEQSYFNSLCEAISKRNLSEWNGWVEHQVTVTKDHSFYYNHKSNELIWAVQPGDFKKGEGYLNLSMIQEICSRVGSQYNREVYFRNNLEMIDLLQNFYRCYSTYQSYRKHLKFIHQELPNVLILQAFARVIINRKLWLDLKQQCLNNPSDVEMLKLFGKTAVKVVHYRKKRALFLANQDNIVAIQSLIRCNLAQNDYHNLFNLNNPSLKRVYRYINLLELDANDYLEEKELAELKNLVFDKIRQDAELENELKEMDLKIGLLVKNRINLQETMNLSSKTKKRVSHTDTSSSLTYEKVQLRRKYGQLFYILQHFPIYWAHILMPLSGGHSAKYVRETTMSLFNLGTTSRDEYYMLRAFESALNLEIQEKIDSLKDFNRDDPTVTKIAISFYRDKKAPTFLQPLLSEPVFEVINLKGCLTTNPVDVYKQYVSKVESETGQSSGLPYDVEADKALEVEEVRNMLSKNVDQLIQITIKFRDSIISNYSLIPYGIRYYGKTVYECSAKKFEGASEEELLKVVGNLIYYRFINPAIVSPDGYGLMKGKEVSTEQRRNLAFVGTILHNCAICKLFDNPISLLQPLDDCMKETAIKFAAFFRTTIEVESLEQHFKINEFTDQTTIQKPELKISCGTILEIHGLLRTHADILPTGKTDLLVATLEELGDVPKITDLFDHRPAPSGKGDSHAQENFEEFLSNTVITLSLQPPKIITESDETKIKELLTQSLYMLVDILRFTKCDTIPQVLESTFTDEQEEEYKKLLEERSALLAGHEQASPQNKSDQQEETKPLKTLNITLEQIRNNFTELEAAQMISSEENYKSVLIALLKLILQRSNYIKSRKIDMARYRSTLENLETKKSYMSCQMESYNQYIKGCVANMSQKKKNKKKQVIKQSASKLHKMGVLIEIDGLPQNKYKSVSFEFSTTEDPGRFTVSGHLLGVELYKCDIAFEDLLTCKFNNNPFLKLSGVATVNVSLLIFFLNQNFYIQK